ncbi:MAG: hypothetical protein R3234_11245 [Thermoanaerobaculia bacterium]|nr:hypothetical protein [Thermoanaerobaculia bacterium]
MDRSLRELRHELLTPVNHVIGYAELARDEAEDEGRDELASKLQIVAERGADLAAGIRDELSGPSGPDPRALARRLGPPYGACREQIEELREGSGSHDREEDLKRIEAGLRTLGVLLQGELSVALEEWDREMVE